jgi:hypothetical protein
MVKGALNCREQANALIEDLADYKSRETGLSPSTSESSANRKLSTNGLIEKAAFKLSTNPQLGL